MTLKIAVVEAFGIVTLARCGGGAGGLFKAADGCPGVLGKPLPETFRALSKDKRAALMLQKHRQASGSFSDRFWEAGTSFHLAGRKSHNANAAAAACRLSSAIRDSDRWESDQGGAGATQSGSDMNCVDFDRSCERTRL